MPQNLKEIRAIVLAELSHIPKGPEPQGELRMLYWKRRMHSLGRKVNKKKAAKEVLQESVASLRKEYPDFEFKYDEQFFFSSGEV